MRRHIPGLHSLRQDPESNLDGLFLVRVERASYRWHRQKSFLELRFIILEPEAFASRPFTGRLYCTDRALWKLNWFLRDFGYDTELLNRDQVDEKSVLNLRGVIRTSHTTLNGRAYQNLDAFAPAAEWEPGFRAADLRLPRIRANCPAHLSVLTLGGETPMVYSYTQISQYLRCPRSYRYRYLDGWREKETRATMAFGRCFENALGAYFRGEDCGAALFTEWSAYRDAPFEYKKGDTWDRLVHQGVHLLERFAQDNRVRIPSPATNLQIKILQTLPGGSEFVSYLDAIGEVDGVGCLIDWKTTTSRYPQDPEGLLSLDPQLICYSWISGISEVAMVVFVRKHAPEIQYLRASISEEQRREFGRLVETTINQIEAGHFNPHSGIRFPQNGCVSCSHLGLCLNNEQLVAANLIRKAGASDLDWLDELVD
jgi:PD-(D/E)XK nuclease superfamily